MSGIQQTRNKDEYYQALKKRAPYIQLNQTSIYDSTNYNSEDFQDIENPIYMGFLADNILKIFFTVKWNTVDLPDGEREFQVIKFNKIYIDTMDENAKEEPDYINGLSANVGIVHALFDKVLSFYSIRLNRVHMYNYSDFESIDFTFDNLSKKEALLDYINETLKRKLR